MGLMSDDWLRYNPEVRAFSEKAFFQKLSQAAVGFVADQNPSPTADQALVQTHKGPQPHAIALSKWLQKSQKSLNGVRQFFFADFMRESRYSEEFEELCRLGSGGFGEVVEAKHRLDGQRYAVKKIVLRRHQAKLGEKVLREVITLAALKHSNVIWYVFVRTRPVLGFEFSR
jgi:serine/threonine protein kinase